MSTSDGATKRKRDQDLPLEVANNDTSNTDKTDSTNETQQPRKDALIDPENEDEQPKKTRRCTKAQFWYYKDNGGNLQGPFYPGQMKLWLDSGMFPDTHPVAPSFNGEVPQLFTPIVEQFPSPLSETAFACGPGIASMPPPERIEEPQERQMSREELEQILMKPCGVSHHQSKHWS